MPSSLEQLTDLQTPWCVHVVATLRVAEHMAAGASTAEQLAAAAGVDARALSKVLVYLAGRGVFELPEPGRFALNDTSRQLLEQTDFLDLGGIGGRMAYAWGTLPNYVRTGRPAYEEQFALPFWEDLAAHPEVAESFDALMGPAGHGPANAEFELADGWDGVRTVVDVGGGTGSMLAEILRRRPSARGILIDFPGTVARAAETFAAAGVADRISAVGQSFFEPLPAGADLYLLKKVLNDWPEPETVATLGRCADAARPGGRIVVIGGVSPDGSSHALTIEMVLVGGETNTIDEFTELARRAGLEVVAATVQPRGFVVECRPL